jgi:hypothetical protein
MHRTGAAGTAGWAPWPPRALPGDAGGAAAAAGDALAAPPGLAAASAAGGAAAVGGVGAAVGGGAAVAAVTGGVGVAAVAATGGAAVAAEADGAAVAVAAAGGESAVGTGGAGAATPGGASATVTVVAAAAAGGAIGAVAAAGGATGAVAAAGGAVAAADPAACDAFISDTGSVRLAVPRPRHRGATVARIPPPGAAAGARSTAAREAAEADGDLRDPVLCQVGKRPSEGACGAEVARPGKRAGGGPARDGALGAAGLEAEAGDGARAPAAPERGEGQAWRRASRLLIFVAKNAEQKAAVVGRARRHVALWVSGSRAVSVLVRVADVAGVVERVKTHGVEVRVEELVGMMAERVAARAASLARHPGGGGQARQQKRAEDPNEWQVGDAGVLAALREEVRRGATPAPRADMEL